MHPPRFGWELATSRLFFASASIRLIINVIARIARDQPIREVVVLQTTAVKFLHLGLEKDGQMGRRFNDKS